MKFLRAVDRLLAKLESGLLVGFLAVMLLLAFTQVALRNLFNSGLLWGDPMVRHLVVWVGFLGAAVAATQEGHISIDALTKFLPARIKAGTHVATNLFAGVVCWYLAQASYDFLKSEAEAGSTFVLDIPTWIGGLIIPVGYLLVGFHFMVRVLESFLVAAGKASPPPPEAKAVL